MDGSEVCAIYMKALGEPTRLQIVKALGSGPLAVSDLSLILEIPIQKVSHHLRVLYNAKILTQQKDGKYVYYSLNPKFFKPGRSSSTLNLVCCTIGWH